MALEEGITALRADEIRAARDLYRQGIEAGHGAIVFAGGPLASGRSALLSGVARTLKEERPRPRILSGRIVNRRYVPLNPLPSNTADVVAAVEGALGLASSALPLLGFLAQAAATSRAAARALIDTPGDSPFGDLQRVLHIAASEGPIACLVDDCDELGGRWWSGLMLGLAAEIHSQLPIFMFMTLTQDGTELEPTSESPTDALFTARELVTQRRLAEWWPLRPIDEDDSTALTGPAETIVRRTLSSFTMGRATWMAGSWSEWRAKGIVERDTDLGPWRFAPGQPERSAASLGLALRDRVVDLVGDDIERVERTRVVLGCAALEGQIFTANAVAMALGVTADDLVDFIDERLCPTGDRDGIVQEVGFVATVDTAGHERSLCRYSFVDPMLRSAFAASALDDDERQRLSRAMAAALSQLFATEPERAAARISRLAAAAGDRAIAHEFQLLADSDMPDPVLIDHAQALLASPIDEPSWSEAQRIVAILLDGSEALSRIGPLEDAAAMAGSAAAIARDARNRPDEARALMCQGASETGAAAHGHLEAALALFDSLGDSAGKASTLLLLGWHELDHHDGDRVFHYADEALTLWRRLTYVPGKISAAILKATAALDQELESAGQLVAEAMALEPYCDLEHLGQIHRLAGTHAKRHGGNAADHFRIASDIFEKLGDLREEAAARLNLGLVLAEDDDPEALETLREAAGMAEVLQDYADEANACRTIGQLLCKADETDAAIEALQRAVDLDRARGDDYMAISSMIDLANALAKRDVKTARRTYDAAAKQAERVELPRLAALVMLAQAALGINSDDFVAAERDLLRALELERSTDHHAQICNLLHCLGETKLAQRDASAARDYAEQELELAERLEDVELQDEARTLLTWIDSFVATGEPFGLGDTWTLEISSHSA